MYRCAGDSTGDIVLTLCLDAAGTIDGDRVFYPASRDEWSPGFVPDERGLLDMIVAPLLVADGTSLTLVDTGYGDDGRPERPNRLLWTLREMGIVADDITRVVITHAHGDHFMGNTVLRGEERVPTYPRAEYVIQAADAQAMRENQRECWARYMQPLVDSNSLRMIDGAVDLDGAVTCVPTPGHTIGHQSVMIRSSGEQALYVGDLGLFPLNFERPEWGPEWAWSFEEDVRSRRKVCEWAVDRKAALILGHCPEPSVVRLTRVGVDRYRARAAIQESGRKAANWRTVLRAGFL